MRFVNMRRTTLLYFLVAIALALAPSGSAAIESLPDALPTADADLALVDAAQVPAAPTRLRIVEGSSDPVNPADPVPPPSGPAPVPSGDHSYFNALAARPDVLLTRSFRSQAQLDDAVKQGPSTYFTYQPDVDAARYMKVPGDGTLTESIPGNQQVRIPIGVSSGSVLITWDFWWGQEFKTNRGKVDTYKSFRMSAGTDSKIYWSLNDSMTTAAGSDDVSMHYEDLGNGATAPPGLAPGVIAEKPFHPTGMAAAPLRTFPTKFGRWTRYWVEVRMDVPGSQFVEWSQAHLNGAPLAGTWDMASLWIADEGRDPQRVIYRVPVSRTPGYPLVDFRFLFNTSTNAPALTGPLVGYARNVVVLRNPTINEADKVLFQRPKP
jgi:hypothetical protein